MTTDYTLKVLMPLVESLPVGTNGGLLHCFWALVSGALLPQRGALIPALQSIGLSPAATRRAWAAFSAPSWQVSRLLPTWRAYVQALPEWERYE